ncbi:titin [Anaeramoeba ignava]|uniref:Titin n=1 Tax=Anaeramoeba ignava TaxID=1746090 RepID=A0A9Q0LTL5_ANAIG|nr:titin [Anaeramoeba ignava]
MKNPKLIIFFGITLIFTIFSISTSKTNPNNNEEVIKLERILANYKFDDTSYTCTKYIAQSFGSDGNNCESYQTACATIEQGLSVSGNSDTVCVYPGHYYLSQTINRQDAWWYIVSTGGPDVTILDGGNARQCMYVHDSSSPLFDGFTFQNCNSGDKGGAIQFYCLIVNWYPVLKNSIFVNNSASKGGAIYNGLCSTELTNILIKDNYASSSGGGLYCNRDLGLIDNDFSWTNVVIVDNTGSGQENIYASSCKYNGNGMSSCNDCYNGGNCQPNGQCVCLAGSSLPTPNCPFCVAGTYSTSTNVASCTQCNQNTYNTGTGNTGCSSCPNGTTNSGNGKTECTPTQMSQPTFDSQTPTSFRLLWGNPPNFSVLGYKVKYTPYGESNWTEVTLVGDVHQYTISNLYSGNYLTQVVGYNNEGTGVWTLETAASTLSAIPPSPPSISEDLSWKSSTSFGITWGNASNGGSPLIGYDLWFHKAGNQTWNTYSFGVDIHSFHITSILSGEYIVKVRAKSELFIGDFSSDFSIWTDPATCPSVITSLNEINHTGDSISINWSAPQSNGGSEIINYQIAFLKIPETNWNYQLVSPDVLEATIPNLIYANYTIAIRALNSITPESDLSYNLTIETDPSTIPSPVNSISQTGKTSSSISISWIKPSNGGSTIIGYKIWYKYENATPSEDFKSIDLFSTNLYYTLTSLLSGTYTIKMQSNNSVGFSNNGTEFIMNTNPPSPPGIMNKPYKISGSPTSITLGWFIPNDQGGDEVKAYKIQYKLSNDSIFTDVINIMNTSLSCIIGDLESETSYDFEIKAYNDAGWSYYWSDIATISTDNSTIPDKILIPSLINSTSTSLGIEWEKPGNGGSDITSYNLYYKLTSDTFWNEILIDLEGNPSPSINDYILNNIYSGNYSIKISATNQNGEGATSDVIVFSTLQPTSPSPISNLLFINSTSTSIYMSWNQPISNGGKPILYFIIEYKGLSSNGSNGNISTNEVVSEYNLTNLLSDSYNITVYSINSIGESEGILVSMNTLSPNIPDIITGLTQISATSTSITIKWDKPNDNGRTIINYIFSFTPYSTNITQYIQIEPPISGYQYQFNSLLSGTFDISISSINEIGQSNYSETLIASTSQPTTPKQMEQVNATTLSSTSIKVNWKKPNNGGLNITSYILSYRFSNLSIQNSTQIEINSTENEYNISNLISGEYSISMKAINPIGECNEWSEDKNISTYSAEVPFKVEELIPIEIRRTYLILSWNEPNNGGRYIEGYNVTCIEDNNLTNSIQIQVNTNQGSFYNLTTQTNYTIIIIPFNSIGFGNSSNFSISTQTFTPSQVEGIFLKNLESYSAVIGWENLNDPDITTYTVLLNTGFNRTNFISDLFSFDNLIPFTNYSVKVRAEINEYFGEWSKSFQFETNKTIPEQIKELYNTKKSYNSLSIEWNKPRINGESIIQYEIKSIKNENENETSETFTTINSGVVANLSSSTNYSIEVRSTNEIGYSIWSNKFYFKTDSEPSTTSKTGLYAGLGTSFGALAVVGGVAFYWYKKRKVVKVTPSVTVYSVNDIDENENEMNDQGNIDDIVMETVNTEKDLYLQSIEETTSKK